MNAHDVRHLTICCKCKELDDSRDMVPQMDKFMHGRCFIALFGLEKFLCLPREIHNEMRLSDIGMDAMKAILKKRDQAAAALSAARKA